MKLDKQKLAPYSSVTLTRHTKENSVTKKTQRAAKVRLVTTPHGIRLVRALSDQSAIKHVVLGTHSARLATQDDLIKYLTTHKVEDASIEAEATTAGEDL